MVRKPVPLFCSHEQIVNLLHLAMIPDEGEFNYSIVFTIT